MKYRLLSFLFLNLAASAAAADITLWEIGKPDHNTAKFAFGPANYRDFRQAGLFIVGQSEAKKDWPYVLPGASDPWAPIGQQPFEIFFAIAAAPKTNCTLELCLADTHGEI